MAVITRCRVGRVMMCWMGVFSLRVRLLVLLCLWVVMARTRFHMPIGRGMFRSEERRVGKEGRRGRATESGKKKRWRPAVGGMTRRKVVAVDIGSDGRQVKEGTIRGWGTEAQV